MYTTTVIGESIREYCERNHITEDELARRAGITTEDVSQIREGKKVKDVETALKIAEAMKCTLTELLEKNTRKGRK